LHVALISKWTIDGWGLRHAVDDGCAPLLRAEVAGVLGKDPAMTIEVFDAVLALAVNGFMELFPDEGTLPYGVVVMSVDVGNDNGEHLSVGADGSGGFAVGPRAGQHDDCVAEVDLDAADGVAIMEVFAEAEDSAEPVAGLRDVAVDEMRDEDVGGDGAVVHADSMGYRVLGLGSRILDVGFGVVGRGV